MNLANLIDARQIKITQFERVFFEEHFVRLRNIREMQYDLDWVKQQAKTMNYVQFKTELEKLYAQNKI